MSGTPRTMPEWQALVATTGRRDLGFATTEGLWLAVVEEAGQLAAAVRRKPGTRPDGGARVRGHAARMLRSCFLVAERVGFDLGEAVWHKYPLACSYCVGQHEDSFSFTSSHFEPRVMHGTALFGALAECECGDDYKDYVDASDTLDVLRSFTDRAPKTLSDFHHMIASIYANKHHDDFADQGKETIFHLLEEINEVAVEIREKAYLGCRNEVADVFTWLCSLATWKRFEIEAVLAAELGVDEA